MEKINCSKIETLVMVFWIIMTFVCPASIAVGSSIVSTDKGTYNYGETIKVDFSNSPGIEGDWICIAPVGSPDNEIGDYKYLPKGLSQGFLTFDSPSPGKYEVRAYYDYTRKGYMVSGRYAFAVSGGPRYERAMLLKMETMARKINPNNPLEANLASGRGMVYILREPGAFSSNIEVPIKANGKPIVTMKNSSYFIFTVPAGDTQFTTGSLFDRSAGKDKGAGVWSVRTGETTMKVKAGYVYYLKLRVNFMGGWASYLDVTPQQEGASLIEGYKLTRIE